MSGLLSKEKKKSVNRLAVLIDYENILRSTEIKILNFEALIDKCLEIGIIDFILVFTPYHLVGQSLPRYLYNRGIYLVVCPSAYDSSVTLKEKDRVDTILSEFGLKLVERTDLTHIVIATQDGDLVRLANLARFNKKKVIAFAGEKISFVLKQAVDEILPLPFKDRESMML